MSSTRKDGDTPDNAAARALPLEGVRVIELSQVMAGPFCGMLLADLGADVIKIEQPDKGDQTRQAMGFKMKGPDSMGFLNLNRNKRSVALDLKDEAGKNALIKMIANSDVLIENFRPGVMDRLGLGYEVLREHNPRLIYASISGFGQTGPWAERPGFDLIAQAMSGVMSVTGYPGGKPVKAGVPVADIGCALFTSTAILSAFIGSQKSGVGQRIDASLFEAALAFSIWDMAEFWGTGRIPEPVGTSNRMSAPYQAVKASDTYFVLGANNARLWERLCKEMGREDLMVDKRFETNANRIANRDALIDELETTFAQATAEEWTNRLLAVGVPAGRLNTYPEAFESDHGRHRKMKIEIAHPVEGTIPNIGFPFKLSETPQRVRRYPPRLGEHTEEVLREFGIRADEVSSAGGDGPTSV
ncbi:CoA transferase [Burkholderia sp. WAC0059]|uniref:CaiB/BaiF CoA transferase family protein n=1 Tax=Burkholderia sp. WAC0059 TaxID=2066022 RepID=UPI000C7F234F|nr:CoA transferase [Burkholderia sp. WAC0059]PLZ00545.1 CoA transferase [Burkholderia sp. WAC0059]